MDIPKTHRDISVFLKKEREEAADLRDKMNFDMGDKRISLIRDRRSFYQNIVIASASILGLASAFSSLGSGKTFYPYLFVGLSLHLFNICIIVMHTRETLDQDLEGLRTTQDEYVGLLGQKLNLVDEHILKLTSTKNDNEAFNLFREYLGKLEKLPAVEKLESEGKKLSEERESRMSGKAPMEFYGELVAFSFISGSFFILAALIGKQFKISYVVIAELFIFWFTFTDFLSRALKPFFKILTFLRRDRSHVVP